MTIERVAFLGLGTMGEGMVANLARAGFTVDVWNRTRTKAEALATKLEGEKGAVSVAERPRDAVGNADAVLLCVSNDAAVEGLVFGDVGVGSALREGTLLVDHGTTSIELSERLDASARQRGAAFLDAPITGSMLGAAAGQLTFMVGGSASAYERFGPLFDAMGKHAVHVGERVGDGQRAKFCLNMTQSVVLQGVLEGYALARKTGIAVEKLFEIFENSAGKTGVGGFKTKYLLAGDFTPHFRLDLMSKDLHLALGLAEEVDLVLPSSTVVSQIYDRARAHGLGAEDFLATSKVLEMEGGFRFRADEEDA